MFISRKAHRHAFFFDWAVSSLPGRENTGAVFIRKPQVFASTTHACKPVDIFRKIGCVKRNAKHSFANTDGIQKRSNLVRLLLIYSSSVLSSRTVASQVLSTMKSLTSVFGMCTGGSFSLSPLEMV